MALVDKSLPFTTIPPYSITGNAVVTTIDANLFETPLGNLDKRSCIRGKFFIEKFDRKGRSWKGMNCYFKNKKGKKI